MSCLKSVIKSMEFLENPNLSRQTIKEKMKSIGIKHHEVKHLKGEKGETNVLKVHFHGKKEKKTLGIIGQLGGVGVAPEKIGLVSDADGAIAALACIIKLSKMYGRNENLLGDVIVSTHITPSAPIKPHEPVPFVDTPVDLYELLNVEIDDKMDAILSIDATKANRIAKHSGFALTPPVKEGWILKIPEDLLNIYEAVTGTSPFIVPIVIQDLIPYGTGISHINSILQPWLKTKAPVLGVATTAQSPIAGSATGANYPNALEKATRFCIEVAKRYTSGECEVYDKEEFKRLKEMSGDMAKQFRAHIPDPEEKEGD